MDNPIEDLPPPRAPAGENPLEPTPREKRRRRRLHTYWALVTLVAFVAGSACGYFLGSHKHGSMGAAPGDLASLMKQINPPEGYRIEAIFGDIGPELIAAGALEFDAFVQVYERAGQPLDEE